MNLAECHPACSSTARSPCLRASVVTVLGFTEGRDRLPFGRRRRAQILAAAAQIEFRRTVVGAHAQGALEGSDGALPVARAIRSETCIEVLDELRPLRCGIPGTEDLVDADRLRLALHAHQVEIARDDELTRQLERRLTGNDGRAVELVSALQTGAEVHVVAHHGQAEVSGRSDVAEHHRTTVQSDAYAQARP